MSPIENRLRASVKIEAHHGDFSERAICGGQMSEAAITIDQLRAGIARLTEERDALVEDKARLDWLESQTRKSPTGISFDWCRYAEEGQVLEHGFRFMRRHFLGERKDDIRAAIDAARQKGEQE